jgi:hypothetical protein
LAGRYRLAPPVHGQAAETYDVSLNGPAGYLNILIPPDAVVASAAVVGATAGISWKFHGVFALRDYQFAQIGVDWFKTATILNVMVQVKRNAGPFLAAGADSLSDRIVERIPSSTVTGYTLPLLSFGNIGKAKEWRGYPILPVNKVQSYSLPISSVDYVIISGETLKPLPDGLVGWKQTQGLSPFLMTIETIDSMYVG